MASIIVHCYADAGLVANKFDDSPCVASKAVAENERVSGPVLFKINLDSGTVQMGHTYKLAKL